jgi:GTP cyclohydrolase II
MSAAQSSSSTALFGSREYTSVSRALGELQARRPVRVKAAGEMLLILPVEGLNNARLAEFVLLCRPAMPDLIITRERALALGLDASAPMAVRIPEGFCAMSPIS